VGLSDAIPLGGSERRFASTVTEPGREPRTISALLREVTPGYFAAIGMRLSAGRVLTDRDTLNSELVAVVNRTFARRYLSASPVGELLPVAIENKQGDARKWKIIGVLDDVLRSKATDPVQPEIFVSVSQMSTGPEPGSFVTIRTDGDPVVLTAELRRIVRDIDPRATVDQPMTMEARLMRSLARPRLFAVLFGGFAVFAALVAMAGLFGGLSYGVTQRTREISLRTALGATRWNIVRLIAGQGAAMTVSGLAIGFTVAAFAARLLSQFLYGVTTHDMRSYLAVAVLLIAISTLACAMPARRAASIDPLKGLKQ
jgi:putative ABC transport system permease protein